MKMQFLKLNLCQETQKRIPLAYQVRIKSYKRHKLNLSCQISHWHHNTLKAVARGPSSLKAQRDAVYSQLSERGEQV